MTRIETELFHKPLHFPADGAAYPDIVRNQTSLYQQRVHALDSQLGTLGKMRTLARQELDMNLPLVKSGDVSQSEILRMQRNVADEIGRASCRERVCQYGSISVGAVALKKKINTNT